MLDHIGFKKPVKILQTQRQTLVSRFGSIVRHESKLEEKPDVFIWPLQDEDIKREVEIVPTNTTIEEENHLPPTYRQIIDQPEAIKQEQAGEVAEGGEEDALSDTALTEGPIDDV